MSSSLKAAMALVASTLMFPSVLAAQEPSGYGPDPKLPAPAETWIPTIKWSIAGEEWPAGATPKPAAGLQVRAFAQGLKHPRWMLVLPNGDVLVAEAASEPAKTGWSPRAIVQGWAQRRSGSTVENANRISILRDGDGDGVAETQAVFLEGLRQPFGMALVGETFYVGNTDGVVAFPFKLGETRITGPGRKLVDFKPAGHWTRSLLLSPDKKKLYAGVGSLTNIAEQGMAVEEGRAAVYELDLERGTHRIFASGLRNAVGLAWEPSTGVLWTVVNERDGLGDETPPDYLTSVRDGGFYGWPYCYWGQTVDDRVPQDPAMVAKAITPDYALGGHTASLGLCWVPAGTLPGFPDGMAIGQHGSWNRSTLSGYKLVFIPFANGKPSGPPRDILSGFLAPDEKVSYGRPVGVTLGHDRKSLLMADDVGNVIFRVTAA